MYFIKEYNFKFKKTPEFVRASVNSRILETNCSKSIYTAMYERGSMEFFRFLVTQGVGKEHLKDSKYNIAIII